VIDTIQSTHDGNKSIKIAHLSNLDKILTVGFTRQSQRQMKIWDPRNTSSEVKKIDIDQQSGVIVPFYDADTGLLYLAGKGDSNVRLYEMVNDDPFVHLIGDFKTGVSSGKHTGWVPKRGLNVFACETARLLKVTKDAVEPLSFQVPRKSEAFQEDLFPHTASYEPAHSGEEWMAGSEREPKLCSLNPGFRSSAIALVASEAANNKALTRRSFSASRTSSAIDLIEIEALQVQVNAANERIRVLEERLMKGGIIP